ncbi:MAG: helix-hairpin-helix domain-containing protein [Phycisphaerae bacterium]|nr:helix-hairpin-helix domain-containing protein [Phycisphaerae bacterium]
MGPARQQALLREFGSVEQIRQQTAERLAEVKGITRALAERVLEALRGQASTAAE